MLERLRERFLADPGDLRAFTALEEQWFVAGRWDDLVWLYQHRLGAPDLAKDAKQRAGVLFRLGQIHAERRGDADAAARCFRDALAASPEQRPALRELRRIHASRAQWDLVLQLADLEIALPMRGEERADLLAETAAIWLRELRDPEQARELLARALSLVPEHPAALEGLARACEAEGQPREAALAWERLVARSRGSQRAAALAAQAALCAGPLGDAKRAGDLYRRALTDDPRCAAAADGLAGIARESGQWSLLVSLLEGRFETAGEPAQRAEIAIESARLQLEQLASPERARSWWLRALGQAPEDPRVVEGLAEVARALGDDTELLRCLERRAEIGGDGTPVSVLLEAASLRSDRGEDAIAASLLERALRQAPDDALVVEALSDTLTRLGRGEDLVDLLERRAALAGDDASTRAAIFAELGALQEERLGDSDAAVLAYQRAYAADPATAGVVAALERLHRKAEDWPSLRRLLEESAAGGPEAQRAGFACALGDLLAGRLKLPAEAARAYQRALETDPHSAPAHRGLRRLAAERGDSEALLRIAENELAATRDPARIAELARELVGGFEARGQHEPALAWAQRWAEIAPESPEPLEEWARLHAALGHDAELVTCLERQAPLLQGSARAANRRRLARHHAERGREADSIQCLESALESDPQDFESLEQLAAQLERAGRIEELVRARRWLADVAPPEGRAACLDALARLLAERMGDVPGAIEALTRLAACPGAPADAGARLEKLLERAGRYDDLAAHLLEARRGLAGDSREALRLDLRRARTLLDPLGHCDEAAALYREVLAQHPGSPEARDGLEKALRAAGDIAGLAERLEARAAYETDPQARALLALEQASLCEQLPDGLDGARRALERALASAPPAPICDTARERLASLLERIGDTAALRALLEASLSDLPPADAAVLHERLGRLCRDRLSDGDAAVHHFEAAARLLPGRPEAWRALSDLHETAGRSSELLQTLEAELATGPDREREIGLRSRAAALLADATDGAERVRRHWERILELDGANAAASDYLIAHWESHGDATAVVELLEQRLEASGAQPRDARGEWAAQRASLRLRIAGLRATRLADPDGAIATLEPALAELGPQPAIAEPLADLYERAGYGDDLIELCERAAAASAEAGERGGWQLRRGAALRKLRREADAAEAYRQVLTDRPGDREAEAALREIYRRLGEHEPLARLLETELSRPATPSEVATRLELASLLAGSLARPGEALPHLRRVLQLEPGQPEAEACALELAERLGEDDLLLELLDAALAHASPPATRARRLLERARRLAPILPADAERDLREALALDPSLTPARADRLALLEQLGRWPELLAAIEHETLSEEAGRRAELLERGAAIAWQRLSPDAALPWLARLRSERPEDASLPARCAEAHRLAGRAEARLCALGEELALLTDPARRRTLLLERARVLERELAAPGRAVAELETLYRVDPEDVEILRELERLHRDLGRPRERVRMLEALLAQADESERVPLLCEAAALWSGPLGDPQRAAAHLQEAVAATPRGSGLHVELLRALGESLRAAGPPQAWARSAEAELRALDPAAPVFEDRRRELARALARAYEHELHRPDLALRHLRSLAEGPAARAHSPEARQEIEDALLRLLRVCAGPVELESHLAARLARAPAGAEDWLELARLRDEKLRAGAAAADAYRRALDLAPDSLDALRGLRGVAERLGAWNEVAETLERELEQNAGAPGEERAALLRRLGDVCWQRLKSTTQASRCYAAALEADPRDFEALHALERLLEAMEDWRGALDLYESEVEMLGERDPERRQHACLRAGEIARDRTGEPARALRAYLQAAELGPLAPAQRAALAELHLRCGDAAAFAEVFASWCDDPAAGAGAADHLRLAEALEGLGRHADALACVERSLAVDGGQRAAWKLAARVREALQDVSGAARAWASAAALGDGTDAADAWVRAADLSRAEDPPQALAWLEKAARLDSGSSAVQAALASAREACGDRGAALVAAERALELFAGAGDPAQRCDTARLGARCGLALGRLESAVRCFGVVLDLVPADPEAQAGLAEACFSLGDLAAARRHLEACLAHPEPNAQRALHLVRLGRCLEADREADAALARFQEALALDSASAEAHERIALLHERAGRIEPALEALMRWAEHAPEPATRGGCLLRAAEIELRAGGREAAAEQHLRAALEAEPACARAWLLLATRVWESGRASESLDLATRALAQIADAPERAALSALRGRALERLGEARLAAEAFGVAAAADPRCVEAAVSAARLLRAQGQWRAAGAALADFAQRHPGDDPAGLADVYDQLGRLRAGPLEDVDGAIQAYRSALALEPERAATRAALAQLLSHRPADWPEALAQHRAALEADPTLAASLRAVLRIAEGSGRAEAAAHGRAILRALGAQSAAEPPDAPAALARPLAAGETLDDPLAETLRQLAQQAAREIAEALDSSPELPVSAGASPLAAFRAAALAAQGRLTAPALLPLTAAQHGEVLGVVANLVLEPDLVRGGGQLVNGLASALGRRARRRLRRALEGTSPAAIAALDWGAWLAEVRTLAAAVALDETRGDLRTALLACLADDAERPADSLHEAADLTVLVSAHPEARSLLRRAVRAWLDLLQA
jgi:tetratricopeptide (TPR) repeat protein